MLESYCHLFSGMLLARKVLILNESENTRFCQGEYLRYEVYITCTWILRSSHTCRVDRGLHEAYYLWKSVDVSKGRCFYQTVVRELCGQLYMMIAQYLYLTGRHSSYTGLLPSQEVCEF